VVKGLGGNRDYVTELSDLDGALDRAVKSGKHVVNLGSIWIAKKLSLHCELGSHLVLLRHSEPMSCLKRRPYSTQLSQSMHNSTSFYSILCLN